MRYRLDGERFDVEWPDPDAKDASGAVHARATPDRVVCAGVTLATLGKRRGEHLACLAGRGARA